MKLLARMIALLLLIMLAPALRAGELVSSAQLLFPIQDNRWQLIRLTLNRLDSDSGTLTLQDSRGGPVISRRIEPGDTPQFSMLLALPLVAADALQDAWPVRVEARYAGRTVSENIHIPITHETQPVYRLLVQHEALVEAGSLRAVSAHQFRMAEITAAEIPQVSGADGILLPRSALRRSDEIPRHLLACGTDIWAQGSTPPGAPDSPLRWRQVADSSQGPELTLWQLPAPAGQLMPVDPRILKLPLERPEVPDLLRQVALWLPVAGTILIVAMWLMTRRAWVVWLILALVLPTVSIAALVLTQQSYQARLRQISYSQGTTSTRILCQHTYLSAAELISRDLEVPRHNGLPAMPLAGNPQQWFGLSQIVIPQDANDESLTVAPLPSRQQLVLYTRSVQLPNLITSPSGETIKAGVFDASGQTWETWLAQRPAPQRNAWRAWWVLSYRPENAYMLSATDWPVAWQMDGQPPER